MTGLVAFLLGLLPTILTGIIAFYLQRAQKKRDKRIEERSENRKQESLLNLEVTMAAAKLSYACAMALKRGAPNGEVEEGVAEFEKAKEAYYHFLNAQAVEHITQK